MSASSSALVLIVDDRRDVLELNRILIEAEGYATETSSYAGLTQEWLREHLPAVTLLDLVPGDAAPLDLLRRLRRDEATRGIGVVVTSDAPALVAETLRDRSLDIAAGLVMPFAIEDLYAAIATAARHGRTPLPVTAPVPLLRRSADVLRLRHKRLVLRWAQRLSTFAAYRDRADLSLAELQGYGEALVRSIAAGLELGAQSRAVAATTFGEQTGSARAHARLRREQGLGVVDMTREIAALRNEAWRDVCDEMLPDGPAAADVQELLRRVTVACDELLLMMLDAWNESEGGE